MYTCKDCLDYGVPNECPYPDIAPNKLEVSEDGDSWAFYCEGFRGCEPHFVIHRGLKVYQISSFDLWVMDYQTGKWLSHAQCTAYNTDDDLRRYADMYLDEWCKFENKNWEDNNDGD